MSLFIHMSWIYQLVIIRTTNMLYLVFKVHISSFLTWMLPQIRSHYLVLTFILFNLQHTLHLPKIYNRRILLYNNLHLTQFLLSHLLLWLVHHLLLLKVVLYHPLHNPIQMDCLAYLVNILLFQEPHVHMQSSFKQEFSTLQ